MTVSSEATSPRVERAVLGADALQDLISVLRARGHRVLAPTVRDGAIVYDEIASAEELPTGWGDEQEAGHYRLRRREDAARFGYAVGPHSWKRVLFPPRVRLWRARRRDPASLEVVREDPAAPAPPLALIGVRACELHAIDIQDRVLLRGAHQDEDYRARRAGAFIVAVNCTEPAATCFCVSMDTGPRAQDGYDLALTELLDGDHRLLVEVGTARGAEVLAALPTRPASAEDRRDADLAIASAAARMGRTLDTRDLRDLLLDNLEHPRWDEVADRCLTCGNCTLVCPTCFCTSVQDGSDLAGVDAERSRVWDSCFSVEYSHIHGGSIRPSARSRYRQWMTHKLATWFDQFGSSGCVGCGRCIAWCPVGIDLTQEAAAIRATAPAPGSRRAEVGDAAIA